MNELRICTGRGSIDLLNPTPDDVNMADVCTNLSRIRRWNGAIDFTVDQHSRLVEAILKNRGANKATCLAGLLDDSPEYVTGDIAGPLLERLWIGGNHMLNVQAEIRAAIFSKIGLDVDTVIDTVDSVAVHTADMEARACEVWWMLPESPMLDELKARYPEPTQTVKGLVTGICWVADSMTKRLRAYGIEILP